MTIDDMISFMIAQLGTGLFTKREEVVLRHRWIDKKTLKETGDALKVTRERVRLIEAKAIRKFKTVAVRLAAKDVVAIWRLPVSMENEAKFLNAIDRLETALEFCHE